MEVVGYWVKRLFVGFPRDFCFALSALDIIQQFLHLLRKVEFDR